MSKYVYSKYTKFWNVSEYSIVQHLLAPWILNIEKKIPFRVYVLYRVILEKQYYA